MNCPDCGGKDTIITRRMAGQLYKFCDVDECSWEYSTSHNIDYSWVTDEMYDQALLSMVDSLDAQTLLRIPGVHELVSRGMYNDVLASLEESRGEEE